MANTRLRLPVPAPISVPRSDTQTNGSKLGDLAKVVAKPFAVLIGGLLYSPSVADGTLPKLTVEDTGIVTDAAGNTVGYTGANSQLEPLSEQDELNYRTYRANGGQAGINEWMVEKPLEASSSLLRSDSKINPFQSRLRPRIEDGNSKEGWQHIDVRHITGNSAKGAGDLFEKNTTRQQLDQTAQEVVLTGVRVTDPKKRMQIYEKRITVNDKRDRVVVVVDSKDNNRVITMYPNRSK